MGKYLLNLCFSAVHRLERCLIVLLVFLCRFWQILVSPLVGPRCRFHPTCSQYAVQSLRRHGLLRGGLLTLGRLCRCHPFAEGGVDPVPWARKGMEQQNSTNSGYGTIESGKY